MSHSNEKGDNPKGVTRRTVLEMFGLGVGMTAISGLANARQVRNYIEAGREITITTEAEKFMKEWGIVLEGSEVRGPTDFLEYHIPKLKEGTAKRFMGICLTNKAVKVEISYVDRGNAKYLTFEIKRKDGGYDGFAFSQYVAPIPPETKKHHFLRTDATSYKEGPCSIKNFVS